jgi:hypothetical protein
VIAGYKTLGAGIFNVLIALGLGARLPEARALVAAVVVGVLSYGVSLVLDTHALRLLGAAREAAYFATAPFVGAVASLILLAERFRWLDGAAMALMAVGVVLMLREQHGHLHHHAELEHDHLHVHDEHHQHEHDPGVSADEPHAHSHRHEAVVHDHPHVSDVHHRHRH